MRSIHFSEAQKNFDELMDSVTQNAEAIEIYRDDGEAVVVMPESTWGPIHETLHLLSTNTNSKRLRSSIAQLDA